MTLHNPKHDAEHLRAIVDMGSNGIRFSISSLEPSTARLLPTLYQHRTGISLYDAQHSANGERQAIGDETMSAVIRTFKHFKRTCADFGILDENIHVLATEATRTAINSEDFRKQIFEEVGWDVHLMSKEGEGFVGAMGIASSLPEVKGLVMDLGGGSTQLSWLFRNGDGKVEVPDSGAVSMPYGAAAMIRRMEDAEKNGTTKQLEAEVAAAMNDACERLNVPSELTKTANEQGGFTLYLSGGGFRGWGYLLMSKHRVSPYPIPIINGFKASRGEFLGTEEIKSAAASALEKENDDIFRVSDRRASQVPAVAFLIDALAKAVPQIKEVRFCQGGVREGHLYQSLDPQIQSQHPLVVATEPFSSTASQPIVELLKNALPVEHPNGLPVNPLDTFTTPILDAFANLLVYHSTHPRDLQASAALRCTTSGIIAGAHGLTHESRALLALLLCARWGGEAPPTDASFKRNLERLVESSWTLWWINYLGAIAALIAAVFPAGASTDKQEKRLELDFDFKSDKEERPVLTLQIALSLDYDQDFFAKEIKNIEKIGKKKNWIGGKNGTGMKITVDLTLLKTTTS